MPAADAPLPDDFSAVRDQLARQVRRSRAAALRAVNAEMLALYRTIGATLLARERRSDWGPEVLDRLGAELRAAIPGMRALSPANLRAMRAFARAWPDPGLAPPLEQLTWGHIRVLREEVGDEDARNWYATATVAHGWSEDVLFHQVRAAAHVRAVPPKDRPARGR